MVLDLTNKWILIVEDEEFNFLLIREILEPTGANVIWAQSGMEAIEIVKKSPEIDFVLMDIRLPFMSGFETTKRIKKIKPNLLVIAQTAYVQTEIVDQCFASGCDAYICKPFRPQELLNIVQKHFAVV